MSTFGSYNDTPKKLQSEAQTITLKMVRTSDSTATISWNVPEPSIGCDVDTQAYNGILLTVSNGPIKQADKPVDGEIYSDDSTVDKDLHGGSTIGDTLVVYSGYDDKSTNQITITDLEPNVPYYVSGFAVDAQMRYHQGGVYAYSLPYGTKQGDKTSAYQLILLGVQYQASTFDIGKQISHVSGVKGTEQTGLKPGNEYCFKLKLDEDKEFTDYTIDGADAQTYDELITAINTSIITGDDYPLSSDLPKKDTIYFDGSQVFEFNGIELNPVHTFISQSDPAQVSNGEYWYNNEQLRSWDNGSWTIVNFFESPYNLPSIPQGAFLTNGITHGYVREGNTWCERPFYYQQEDPSKPPSLDDSSFWIDDDGILNKWDSSCNKWEPVNPIESSFDPIQPSVGFFWINDVEEKLYRYEGSPATWTEMSNVYFSSNQPSTTVTGSFWIDDELNLYTLTSSGWEIESNVAISSENIANIQSCDVWLNSSSSPIFLGIYNTLSQQWDAPTSFSMESSDPSLAPIIDKGTLWYKDSDLFEWDLADWNKVEFILFSGDPLSPTTGQFYRDNTTGTFYQWDSQQWVALDVFSNEEDPSIPALGTYWYNPTNQQLSQWNGTGWAVIMFTKNNPVPQIGFEYFNTTDEVLYMWNGSGYVPTIGKASAFLNSDGNIVFVTKETGSYAYICVQQCSLNGVFRELTEESFIQQPVPGSDPLSEVPSYDQQGVGTDGSVDERRTLIRQLELQLGAPLNVELTKDHFDTAIRMAMEKFRQVSASAYKRGFQFLKIQPGEQTYNLTSQKLGYHKIVEVMAAYRVQSSFLGNAAGQGAYGQAMIQHLYQMGSFDLVSYHIVSDYVELMNRMFAAYLVFTWNESTRKLSFHQSFGSHEKVLLDVVIERTEQEIIKDRHCKPWIEKYALAMCQMMLSEVRGKYATLPGAGGGVSLNAQDLRVRAETLIQECMDDIDNFVANEIEEVGIGAQFVMG